MSWTLRCAAAAVVTLSLTAPEAAARENDPSSDRTAATRTANPTVHSSDGVRGTPLGNLVGDLRARAQLSTTRTDETGWQVAPGLAYSQWSQTAPQGPTRISLLTASLDEPGLTVDKVSGPTVSARAPLSQWLAADNAIAGVNADFFDIGDTGAPLGVGVDRQLGTLHAPRSGWNTSFVVGTDDVPRVTQDRLVARLVRRGRAPRRISNLNSPNVQANSIGLYTSAWGAAPGRRVVGDATRVRQVVIRGNRVRSNRTRLDSGSEIQGYLLIGRGRGAAVLKSLRLRQRVRVLRSLSVPARAAVSGSVQLLRGGALTTSDNRELHPRTAIGIDRDQRLLHLVVVDGRSASSRGMTLLQLGQLLQSLGDEEALNLDGGGSSTMIAEDASGAVAVRNQPSDGRERSVPNGLGFHYTAPAQ